MALRQILEKLEMKLSGVIPSWYVPAKERDNTPLEAKVQFRHPVSSLADMRRLMEAISKEKEEAGGETYEEFWDFGEDGEDEFVNMPAPAQLRYDAVMAARTRDFEGEIAALKAKRKEELEAELRKELKESIRKDLSKQVEED